MNSEILLDLMILTGMILLSVVMMVRITFTVRKTPAFWSYIIMHTGLLISLIGAFLGTVAPTKPLSSFYESIQFFGLFSVLTGWIFFSKNDMARTRFRMKAVLLLAGTGLWALSTSTIILISGAWYMRILAFLPFALFGCFIYAIWKDHYIDFSSAAFVIFMQKIREVVFVFDDKENLIATTPVNSPIALDVEGISTLAEFKETMCARRAGKDTIIFQDNNINGEAIRKEEIEILINHQQVDCILSITPLGSTNRNIGTVISLRDISQEKELERNLALKNMELQKINAKIQDFIDIEHQLEEEKVRNQIVREIHSTVGKRITQALDSLEELQKHEEAELTLTRERVKQVTEDFRYVLEQIREVVGKLKPQSKNTANNGTSGGNIN